MGWLGQYINKLLGESAVSLTFVPSVKVKEAVKIPSLGQPIVPDECYIELYLESLRLSRSRKLGTKFHGVVYTFVTVVREGLENAQLAGVSKPSKLIEVDESSLDKVITISKKMMGATAFRGNPVSLELGLFSVKSGNILTPVLDYVTRVSSAAGISYVGAVKPFLPLITEGMDLLAGQTKETVLEVGYDTDATLTEGRILAIIDKPKHEIQDDKITLDEDGTLLHKDEPIDSGYAVFSIRSRPDKPDFGEIPDLRESYAQFLSNIRSGNARDARDALASFRLRVVTSPDLIPKDADKLIDKAKKKLRRAFPPGGKASVGELSKVATEKETLADIGLYE